MFVICTDIALTEAASLLCFALQLRVLVQWLNLLHHSVSLLRILLREMPSSNLQDNQLCKCLANFTTAVILLCYYLALHIKIIQTFAVF